MNNGRLSLHLIILLLAIASFTVYFKEAASQLFVTGSVLLIGISAIRYRELLPFFFILLMCEITDKLVGLGGIQYRANEFEHTFYFHPLPVLLCWHVIIDTSCRILIARGHNSNALRAWFGVTTKIRSLPQVKAFCGLLGLEILLSLSLLIEWNLNNLGLLEPYPIYNAYPYIKTGILILKVVSLWSLVVDTSFYYRLSRGGEVNL